MSVLNNLIKPFKEYKNRRFLYLSIFLLCCLYLYIGNHLLALGPMELVESILVGSIAIGGFIAFVIVDYLKGYSKPNNIGAIIIFVLLIIMIVTISITPNTYELGLIGYRDVYITAVINVTNEHKVISIISYAALLIIIYSSLFILRNSFSIRSKFVVYALGAYLVVMLSLCIATIFVQWDSYVDFVTHINDEPQYHAVTGFLPHRNNWGFLLLVTIFLNIFLGVLLSKKWLVASSIIFYIFMLFTFCKATILIGFLLYLVCFVYYLIISFKRHKRRNLIIIASFVVLVIVGLLVIFLSPLKEVVENLVVTKGNIAFEAREEIWKKIFQIVDSPEKILFGVGRGILDKDLYEVNLADQWYSANWGTFKAHNMYIQSYGDGGILLLTSLVVLIVYLFVILIKYFKKEPTLSFVMIVGLCSLLGMWIFES